MIEKLTPEQEKELAVYKDKWLAIGLSTEKCNREAAETCAARAYEVAGLKAPEVYIWADSPEGCIQKQLEYAKENGHDLTKRDAFNAQIYGAHDAGWLSFYDYMLNVVGIKECEKLVPLMDLSKNCGWWAPYEDVCFLQEKPQNIFMEDGKLHNPEGPAISYRDGQSNVYAVFGVTVEKEMLGFNPDQIMAVKNAEQRMVLIKNYGLGNMLDKLSSRVLDTRDEYELVMINLEGRDCEFLKMINPSTGEIHVEGVQPGTTTVDDALNFRLSRQLGALFQEPRVRS